MSAQPFATMPDFDTPMTETLYLKPNDIYCGDATTLLRRIQPETVALSFWSPPYFVGKSYEKSLTYTDWTNLLRSCIHLHFQVVSPGGFLAVNIADILCFADESMPKIQADHVSHKVSKVTREDVLAVLAEHPSYNRYQIAEVLGCSEQTVERRLKNNNIRGGKYASQTRVKLVGGMVEEWATEGGFYLYDRRIWAKDPCWENSKWHSNSYRSVDETEYVYVFWKPGITKVDRSRLTTQEWKDWGSRGIWNIASVRANDDHPAKFPLELASRVIRLFSSRGDVVLDAFVGSGTTAVAAIRTNRQYIGLDLFPEYVELARKNCRLAVDGKSECR